MRRGKVSPSTYLLQHFLHICERHVDWAAVHGPRSKQELETFFDDVHELPENVRL